MIFSGKLFQNFCRLNMNMKITALIVILVSLTLHHSHAQTCGSWYQAQGKPHCIAGSIGLTKRIIDSFQNRKVGGEVADQDTRYIDTQRNPDVDRDAASSTNLKAEYYRTLRRMMDNYRNNAYNKRQYDN